MVQVSDEEWVCCNDSHVQLVSPSEVANSQAYVLIYSTCEGVRSDVLPLEVADSSSGVLILKSWMSVLVHGADPGQINHTVLQR